MEKIRLKYFILVIICLVGNQIIFAQKSDCLIYEKILAKLNHDWNNVKYADTGIVNPLAPEFNQVEIDENRGLNFYIIKNKHEFRINDVKGWFVKLLNDTTIINGEYNTKNNSIVNCQFESMKYQFVEFKEVSSFAETNYKTEGKGKDSIHYAPARITFSNILYYNDQIALVYAKIKIGSGGGTDAIYGFIFKKKKDNWVLKKVENETR